jgi:hypothetical protein
MILAIDPGNTQSGYVLYNEATRGVLQSGVRDNDDMLRIVQVWSEERGCCCAIEMIASYGMPVGREVFDTCEWIGRFRQHWRHCGIAAILPRLIYRKDVKLHLCGQTKAKDSNIWQALLDKFGPVGTKKAPGALYGIKSHARAALAVAVTAAETVQ